MIAESIKLFIKLAIAQIIVLSLSAISSEAAPCSVDSTRFNSYRDYDKAYAIRFESLFHCNISTAQEISEFLHSVLKDEKIDPTLVSQFIATLSKRDPYYGLFASHPQKLDPDKYTSQSVLDGIQLHEEDVAFYLARLEKEPKARPEPVYKNYIYKNFDHLLKRFDQEKNLKQRSFIPMEWTEANLLQVELDTLRLLLPLEFGEVLSQVMTCHIDWWNDPQQVGQNTYCDEVNTKYESLIRQYLPQEKTVANAKRAKSLVEILAGYINSRWSLRD